MPGLNTGFEILSIIPIASITAWLCHKEFGIDNDQKKVLRNGINRKFKRDNVLHGILGILDS